MVGDKKDDMVTPLIGVQPCRERSRNRPWIIEVVGPAGAGKTTLFGAILKSLPNVRATSLPDVHAFKNCPFFIKHILYLMPILVCWSVDRKEDIRLSRRQLAWMAMLNGWAELLDKAAIKHGNDLLLDQGPIFLISTIFEFGPLPLSSPYFRKWRTKIYGMWADTLDLIIYLDSSDEILMKRIRSRSEYHIVKDQSDQVLIDFLKRYRSAYNRAIEHIESCNRHIRLLRYDSGKYSLDELVNKVVAETAKRKCQNFVI
jgi:hypothetical protein